MTSKSRGLEPAPDAAAQNTPRTSDAFFPSASERMILDIVRRHRAISRAAIASETDLAQQSIHRLVEQLIERGLLRAG
jgi:DNA-binding MarR family transcriptional regulator